MSRRRPSCGVAIGPAADLWAGLLLGKLKRHTRRGTATLRVRVPAPGKLRIGGKGLMKRTVAVREPGRVKLPVRPRGKKKRRLARNGSVTVGLKVTYWSGCGCSSRQRRTVVLRKSR